MADDDDEDKAKSGTKPEGGGKRGNGMLGPILALILVLGIGAGLGIMLHAMIAPPPVSEDEQAEDGEDDIVSESRQSEADLFANTQELLFEDVIANLKGEVGRYVKVTVGVWFDKNDEDAQKIMTDLRVKRLLQEQMIEELRTYDQKQLADEFVLEQIRKGFKDRMDRELRRILDSSSEKTYVKKVVMSDLILQ